MTRDDTLFVFVVLGVIAFLTAALVVSYGGYR